MSLDDGTTEVFSFTTPEEASSWESVDDRVLGGVSSSRMVHLAQGARFAGVVSLVHGGGFASVRSGPLPVSLEGCSGLLLRVRGDGRTYKLCAGVEAADGVLWQARFTPPPDDWTDVKVSFDQFVPTRDGRVVRAPTLTGADVREIGLMVSDRQSGPFSLDLESIAAFR